MKSVLLIDDHEEFRLIVATILRDAQYDVWEASCPENAFQILDHELPNLIICDLHMPFTTSTEMQNYEYSYHVGVRTIEELQWALPETPIVVMSAAVPADVRQYTAHLPSVVTLPKPVQSKTLLATIEFVLNRQSDVTLH
jgi:CheY-like chemotaxis protein